MGRHHRSDSDSDTDESVSCGFETSFSEFQPPYEGSISNFRIDPASTTIAAGPRHVIAMVNSSIAIYAKKTPFKQIDKKQLNGNDGFFGLFSNNNINFFAAPITNPYIIYDPHVKRYIAIAEHQISTASPTQIGALLIAVSKNDRPKDLKQSSWYFYQINRTQNPGVNPTYPDASKIGYDSENYYISEDNLSFITGTLVNHNVYAIRKKEILSGPSKKIVQVVDNLITSTSDSFITPVQIYDCHKHSQMFCAQASSPTSFILWAITNLNPGISTTMAINTLTDPIPVPQPPPSLATINAGDTRFQPGVVRNNHLWIAQTGIDLTVGPNNTIRWYDINLGTWPISGLPSLDQQASITPPNSGDYLFYPAVNVNKHNDLSIAFSIGGTTRVPSIALTGRLSSDVPNTTRFVISLKSGVGAFQSEYQGNGPEAWGEYSGLALDPDGTTFWLHNMFPKTIIHWGTYIQSYTIKNLSPNNLLPSMGGAFQKVNHKSIN